MRRWLWYSWANMMANMLFTYQLHYKRIGFHGLMPKKRRGRISTARPSCWRAMPGHMLLTHYVKWRLTIHIAPKDSQVYMLALEGSCRLGCKKLLLQASRSANARMHDSAEA
eukprot:3146908-Amphidinium_carterae.1